MFKQNYHRISNFVSDAIVIAFSATYIPTLALDWLWNLGKGGFIAVSDSIDNNEPGYECGFRSDGHIDFPLPCKLKFNKSGWTNFASWLLTIPTYFVKGAALVVGAVVGLSLSLAISIISFPFRCCFPSWFKKNKTNSNSPNNGGNNVRVRNNYGDEDVINNVRMNNDYNSDQPPPYVAPQPFANINRSTSVGGNALMLTTFDNQGQQQGQPSAPPAVPDTQDYITQITQKPEVNNSGNNNNQTSVINNPMPMLSLFNNFTNNSAGGFGNGFNNNIDFDREFENRSQQHDAKRKQMQNEHQQMSDEFDRNWNANSQIIGNGTSSMGPPGNMLGAMAVHWQLSGSGNNNRRPW